LYAPVADSIRQFDRIDASDYRMSNGRFRRVVDATRGVPIQRGRRPLERSDGHGQRSGRSDGQPERMPFAGQDLVAAVRHDLPGPVFRVRRRQ